MIDTGTAKGGVKVFCLIPPDLASKLHDPLRRHFSEDPTVEVVVEQRAADRRRGSDRRSAAPQDAPLVIDRRRIRARHGRRVAERRARAVAVDAPSLPRRLRDYADRLAFVERLEPSTQAVEDADTSRLVARIQAGDSDAFAALYMRYFDRVYSYLRVLFKDTHSAEDTAQQVFIRVMEGLPGYERRDRPFRAWLFTVARNQALRALDQRGRRRPTEPAVIDRVRDRSDSHTDPLEWLTDADLMLFIGRLPVAQRQVLMLRYMLDLSLSEIAAVLGRTPQDVRQLHSRSLAFLRVRLAALGRTSAQDRPRVGMRRSVRPMTVIRSRRFSLSA